MMCQHHTNDGMPGLLEAFVFLGLAALVAAQGTMPEGGRAGTVTANVLNIRSRPAQHYERIGQFERGDRVVVIRETDDWLEVRVPNDTRGWIAAQFLGPDGMVTGNNVRLHSGPGLVFTSFARLSEGTKLEVMGPSVDGWQQVRAPAEATAWVSRAYVRIDEPVEAESEDGVEAAPAEEPLAADSAAAEDAAATAVVGESRQPEARAEPVENDADSRARSTPAALPVDAGLLATQTTVIPKVVPGDQQPGAEDTPIAEAPGERTAAKDTVAPDTREADEDDGSQAPVADAPTEAPAKDDPGETAGSAAVPEAVAEESVATLGASEAIIETTRMPAVAAPADETAAQAYESTPETQKADGDADSAAPAPGLTTAVRAVEATQDADTDESLPPPRPSRPLVMKTGVVLSLKSQASEAATHALFMRIRTTGYPICYLKSSRIDLSEWEKRPVRVYGRDVQVPGWSKPVLDVYSIQIDTSE